jgi:hypothetical protein
MMRTPKSLAVTAALGASSAADDATNFTCTPG